LHAFNTQMWI